MKKKIQKPFSVEEWKNGAKIETRSGCSVRMLCTDLKDNYPIVAAITVNDGTECSCIFDADGHFCTGSENDCDLVIVEEVEESRWAEDKEARGNGWTISQEGVAGTYYAKGMPLNDCFNFDVFATMKQAKSALAMARISQLMEHDERYGGVVTDEEWEDKTTKYAIERFHNVVACSPHEGQWYFLAFHTPEQRELFRSENERLVKDYLMID